MQPVPEHLVGLWRRLSVTTPVGTDTTTEVYWLQTSSAYVDLRIPAGRPDFSGCRDYEDLNAEQLAWLATQQGFAGRLAVEEDVGSWHRDLDFQPPSPVADVGRFQFHERGMTETGVLQDYSEEWVRETSSSADRLALKLWHEHGPGGILPKRAGYIVVVGEHFMYARGRLVHLPRGTTLLGLFDDQVERADRRHALLDCIIDYGRRSEDGQWRILRSNHPWREGHCLLQSDLGILGTRNGMLHTHSAAGIECQWEILEQVGNVLDIGSCA